MFCLWLDVQKSTHIVNDFLGHCTLNSIVNRGFVSMGFPFMLFSGTLWDEYGFANVTEIKIKFWKQSTKKSNYENTKTCTHFVHNEPHLNE